MTTENLKMPEPMGSGMISDVNRWARGDQGCAGTSTVAGWGAEPPPAVEVAVPPIPKLATKKKSAITAKSP